MIKLSNVILSRRDFPTPSMSGYAVRKNWSEQPIMLKGHIDRLDRHYLSGWAIDTENPDALVDVAVWVNGHEWQRVKADNPRNDLRERGDFGNGEHGFTYLFDRPMSLLTRYKIQLIGHCNGQSAPLVTQDLGPSHSISPSREPILVTASGRSGTTILMKHLLDSPSILVADKYPYEMKILTYYATAFDILTKSGNHIGSPDLGEMFSKVAPLGPNPFNHYEYERVTPNNKAVFNFFETKVPATLTAAFKSIVQDFYAMLAEQTGQQSCVYFAEKADILHSTRAFTRMAFGGTKEIVLLRDPRDLFCSYRSFWQTPMDVAISALKAVTNSLLALVNDSEKNNMIFIKYEDLVLQKEAVLQRLSEFLNLDTVMRTDPEEERKLFQKHGSSEDASASVGRWRRDMSSEQLSMFATPFDSFFRAFDYEPLLSVNGPSSGRSGQGG